MEFLNEVIGLNAVLIAFAKIATIFSVAVASSSEGIKPAILLSEKALKHLNKMRAERNEDLCLRIGVRQGGCSGMSYIMDFEQKENTRPDDSVINYDGFRIGELFIFYVHSVFSL